MNKEEIKALGDYEYDEKTGKGSAPKISDRTREIIATGGQLTILFGAADAEISFHSRWALAELIDTAIGLAVKEEMTENRPPECAETIGDIVWDYSKLSDGDFFSENGDKYLNPFSMPGADPTNRGRNYTGTVEELYQAFKERLIKEVKND